MRGATRWAAGSLLAAVVGWAGAQEPKAGDKTLIPKQHGNLTRVSDLLEAGI